MITIQLNFWETQVTKGRLRQYFYAGQIAYFSFTYEKVNKTDSLQQATCLKIPINLKDHIKFLLEFITKQRNNSST